jgi:P2 family phage contractile tail tube protein
MAARFVRKNFTLSVDGRGYAGDIEEFNAPKLTLKTDEFRAGGMDAPIKLNMGMEVMDCDFSMKSYSADVMALFGLAEGNLVPLIAREVLESADGTVTAVIHTIYGTVTEMDPGTSKPGEAAMLKITMNLRYYKLEHGSRIVHEVDIVNMIHVVDGADVLADQRAALGL